MKREHIYNSVEDARQGKVSSALDADHAAPDDQANTAARVDLTDKEWAKANSAAEKLTSNFVKNFNIPF